jgi:hypothetical protein
MLSSFVDMSLFTDPMGDGKFTREWTVFYWLWWISYAPAWHCLLPACPVAAPSAKCCWPWWWVAAGIWCLWRAGKL